MKRLIATVALLFISLLLVPAAGAQAAAADTANYDTVRLAADTPAGIQGECTFGRICGHIYNDDDVYSLKITNHWPDREHINSWQWLHPGQTSHGIGTKDADGFFVPSGCTATIAFLQNLGGPAWYQVHNGQHIHVTNISC